MVTFMQSQRGMEIASRLRSAYNHAQKALAGEDPDYAELALEYLEKNIDDYKNCGREIFHSPPHRFLGISETSMDSLLKGLEKMATDKSSS
jgi:hypothetical protein